MCLGLSGKVQMTAQLPNPPQPVSDWHNVMIMITWVCLNFMASSAFSISNKVVVGQLGVSPALLGAIQCAVSLLFDGLALVLGAETIEADREQQLAFDENGEGVEGNGHADTNGSAVRPVQKKKETASTVWRDGVVVMCGRVVRLVEPGSSLPQTIRALMPVALCLVLGKLSTLLSYQLVSVSLAHAAKSLEPVINVALVWVLFREVQPLHVNLTLIPVVVGVYLTSAGESTYSDAGFFLAAASAAFRVMEKVLVKRAMAGRALGFFQLHFAVGFMTTVVLVLSAAVEALLGTGSAPGAAVGQDAMTTHASWRLLGCALLGYATSLASYAVLTMMAHLSFTVVNTMKRLVTMGASIVFFGTSASAMNAVGMVTAVLGAMSYSLAKQTTPSAKQVGRTDPSSATDAERAQHDPAFEADLVRTVV